MKNNSEHQQQVLKAGLTAIVVNLLLAIFKIIIGFASNSIAVMSDAIHGVIDTLSGIIVVVSEKLGSSHRFKNNHAKIEHIGALLIAIIIIVVGAHLFIESIEGIIKPETTEYNAPIIIILIISIISKLMLGQYLRTTGKKAQSDTLIASSVETINDSIISGAVLLSALIHLITHINIEPYISLVISILIIKTGANLILPFFSKK